MEVSFRHHQNLSTLAVVSRTAHRLGGYTHGGANNDKEKLFDGYVFDPAGDMESYAASFTVKTLKG